MISFELSRIGGSVNINFHLSFNMVLDKIQDSRVPSLTRSIVTLQALKVCPFLCL